jgi:hypothetical protein
MQLVRRIVATAVLSALALCSSSSLALGAQRGVGPLLVPSSTGRLHTSTNAHIAFDFPKGTWTENSPLAGDGFFSRRTRLNGQHCDIGLTIIGTGKRLRPSLTTTAHSDHIFRGIAGNVHWLSAFSELPPTPPMLYAQAYWPAPSWMKVRWATVRVTTHAIRIGAPAWCRRSLKRIDVAAIARSAHVGHGSARHI